MDSDNVDDLSEDRMLALRKRAELDSKYVVLFNQNDSSALHRLGSAFAELANLYYRDEGRRIKLRLEKKTFNSSSIELNIRYCFKVRVLFIKIIVLCQLVCIVYNVNVTNC